MGRACICNGACLSGRIQTHQNTVQSDSKSNVLGRAGLQVQNDSKCNVPGGASLQTLYLLPLRCSHAAFALPVHSLRAIFAVHSHGICVTFAVPAVPAVAVPVVLLYGSTACLYGRIQKHQKPSKTTATGMFWEGLASTVCLYCRCGAPTLPLHCLCTAFAQPLQYIHVVPL